MSPLIKKALHPVGNLLSRIIKPHLGVEHAYKPIHAAADFVFAEAVPGDYLEFGTFKGASFIEAYHRCEKAHARWANPAANAAAFTQKNDAAITVKPAMRYFAFDSFEGLPALTENDTSHSRFSKGRYDFSREAFTAQVTAHGVNMAKVVICPGFYDKSLTQDLKASKNLRAAAIVMIDCDLYESTRPVLEFITDLVQDGTVLIFDDWFAFKGNPNKGEQRAVAEWLAANPHIALSEYMRWGPVQKAFVVHLAH
jgi:O-methyltransferase